MSGTDYLITNARILDPESGADFYGSLAVSGGKIAGLYPGMPPVPPAGGVETLDARGGLLLPGFIDIHAHTDNDIPCAESLLSMGVTTAHSGNCGLCPVDFPAFFDRFRRQGYPVHQAEQAGHGSLRIAAGQDNVYAPLNTAQMQKLKALVLEAFDAGAAGLSFGLEYAPGASPKEVRSLAECAFALGKTVSIHTRQRPDPLDSIREALSLCETGGRVIISHLVYMYVGDGLRRVLDAIEDCRARGGGVWADSGVYTAFATFAGTPVFDEDIFRAKGYCAEKVRAATGKYAGQYLDQHKFREVRTLFPKDSLIYDPGSPGDIETAYSLPGVMVSTDCIGGAPKGQGHPQGAATYPLFFRRMVRETGKLSLLDAVRRCTLFPARALGYEGKGRLAVGADADIVVLDWERLRERAAFPGEGDPCAAPEGVIHVLVQGRPAIAYGTRIEGVFAGTCL